MNPQNHPRSSASICGSALRTLLLALFLCPWTMLWGGAAMIIGPKRRRLATRAITAWGRGIVRVAGIKLDLTRTAPLDPQARYIFMCNHQSALDIPILISACQTGHDVRFMAKESLFKIPFLGWGMSRTGFVPIRRENARHSAELFQAITQEKPEHSYVIFPEGTRSPDGRLQPLKRGSFGLALRMSLPVVPVTLIGACYANPKGRYLVRPGTVRLVFHEPIPPRQASQRDGRDELLERVSSAILSSLPEDQRPRTEALTSKC